MPYKNEKEIFGCDRGLGGTRGTHRAPLGNIPASGNPVALPWIMISRLDGGKIVEEWEFYDSLDLMKQVGAIPADR